MIKKINFPNLKYTNFLIIPIPFEDELLSSWIVRTAYAHKTHPHTFTNQYLNYRHYAFFLTDSDITLDDKMISIIKEKSYNKVDIDSLMLKSYAGKIQENINVNNPTTYFTHLKYCPICLSKDVVPYFRKQWRTVFYNICHKHYCYLYESCPKCRVSLDISKMYDNKLFFTHCHNCGFELKKARRLPVNLKYISALNYQNKIFMVIDDGYIVLGNQPIYSFLFFDIFYKFTKLILLKNKHEFINKHPLFTIMKNAEQQKCNHPILKKINSKAQSALFGLIMYIFDDFLLNLKSYLLLNQLTYYNMTTKMLYVPFWYEKALNVITPQHLPHCMTVTKEEV